MSKLTEALLDIGYSESEAAVQVCAVVYKKRAPSDAALKIGDIDKSDALLTDLHFHDLRHEATSRLADKLQMHELMKVTGHKHYSMLNHGFRNVAVLCRRSGCPTAAFNLSVSR
jgi:integrase